MNAVFDDPFDGREDFSLWRQLMIAILFQMKVANALKGEKFSMADFVNQRRRG